MAPSGRFAANERLNETSTLLGKSTEPRRRFVRPLLFGAMLVAATVLGTSKYTCFRTSSGAPTKHVHHEKIPTLLSVIDDQTGELMYALDHPLYDMLQSSQAVWHDDPIHQVHDAPLLNIHDAPRTAVLSWTEGSHHGQPLLLETDILALRCDGQLVEAATIAQARATSGERHTWTIDKAPLWLYSDCSFTLYHFELNQLHPWASVSIGPGVTVPANIHWAPTNRTDSRLVQFVTQQSGTPIVIWGERPEALDQSQKGTTTTYGASDLCGAPANETRAGQFSPPGQLHSAMVSGLEGNKTYYYKVGLSYGQGTTWSDVYSFHVFDDKERLVYLVYGDQGCPSQGWGEGSLWTTALASREDKVQMIHHFGDLSYAQGAGHQWDSWFRMIQPFSTRIPMLVSVGNHEYDHKLGGANGKDPSGVATDGGFHPVWGNFGDDSGGECGVPTAKRFTMPETPGSNGVFWYSLDSGLLHTVVLSSEHDLSEGSPQRDWLVSDLVAVDRSRTPWLVLELHRPLYEAEAFFDQNAVGIGMRYEIEDLLYDFKVDVVFAGHYHAYHRSCDGLYRSKCDNDGPIHITIGTAGAHLDVAELYPNKWSAKFIQQEYGYGRVTVSNASTILFEFVRAGAADDDRSGEVLDSIVISRNR